MDRLLDFALAVLLFIALVLAVEVIVLIAVILRHFG